MRTDGVRAGRARRLVDAYEAGDLDVIRFVQATSTVHVLGPAGEVPDRYRELFGDDPEEEFLRAAIGEVWTVCGVRFVRHRGGFDSGAQLVSHFPDELLCRTCHLAFGPEHGHLIFEVNQDDGRDPSQLGRLDDLVTRGPALR